MFPKIEMLRVNSKFKYLWLKYVKGVNLELHCAKCLRGYYSELINSKIQELNGVFLDEYIGDYYYLCGVAEPRNWGNNFHLAFEYSTRENISIDEKGIKIIIRNAKRIPIIKEAKYDHSNGDKPEFNTCRNWQAICLSNKEAI